MGHTQGLVGYSMRVIMKDSREPGGARRAAAGGTEGDRESGWGSAGGQAGDHKHLMRQESRSRRKAGGKT